MRARAVIVAVPPNLTAAIRFHPALPAWRQRLGQALSQGSINKILAVYEQPFWREEGLSGQGFAPYELVRELYDNSPPSATAGVLTTFLAGENAERAGRMSAADRRAAVLEGMAKYVGPQALRAGRLHRDRLVGPGVDAGRLRDELRRRRADPLRRGPAPADRADPLGLHRHRGRRTHPHGGGDPLGRACRQGLPGGDPRLASRLTQSGRPDLNRGPHRPERCALPGCATPRGLPVLRTPYSEGGRRSVEGGRGGGPIARSRCCRRSAMALLGLGLARAPGAHDRAAAHGRLRRHSGRHRVAAQGDPRPRVRRRADRARPGPDARGRLVSGGDPRRRRRLRLRVLGRAAAGDGRLAAQRRSSPTGSAATSLGRCSTGSSTRSASSASSGRSSVAG